MPRDSLRGDMNCRLNHVKRFEPKRGVVLLSTSPLRSLSRYFSPGLPWLAVAPILFRDSQVSRVGYRIGWTERLVLILFSEQMRDRKKIKRHRRGLGRRHRAKPELEAHYQSELVDYISANGHRLVVGDLSIHLAKEFGFCYGVDRAVEYAYETLKSFPERRVWLVGEIIHNPHVNEKMLEMGIQFLFGRYGDGLGYDAVSREDVVILPAFGLPMEDMERLHRVGCDLVDTTCGSVIMVWKNVQSYAQEGFTSVIHGKFYHEETMATASRATDSGGHYLILLDLEETMLVCDYIRGAGMDQESFLERFEMAVSPGFDPDAHLERLGLANQTTMLMSESLQVAEVLRRAMVDRYGEKQTSERFRNFETICSATQERQDAILELLEQPLDIMLVIGGYNSSNTNNLAHIAGRKVTTYHIDSAKGILPDNVIDYKPVGAKDPVTKEGWLTSGPLRIGITAGASTPNNEIGTAILHILEALELQLPEEVAAPI